MTPPHKFDDEVTLPFGIHAKGRLVFTYLGYLLAGALAAVSLTRPSGGAEFEKRISATEMSQAVETQRLQRIEADLSEVKADLKTLLRSR